MPAERCEALFVDDVPVLFGPQSVRVDTAIKETLGHERVRRGDFTGELPLTGVELDRSMAIFEKEILPVIEAHDDFRFED